MKTVLEYLVKNIVDNPQKVEVFEEKNPQTPTLSLKVAKEDMAKVIGKNGKTIKALRTIMRIAAAKTGTNVNVVLSEDQ